MADSEANRKMLWQFPPLQTGYPMPSPDPAVRRTVYLLPSLLSVASLLFLCLPSATAWAPPPPSRRPLAAASSVTAKAPYKAPEGPPKPLGGRVRAPRPAGQYRTATSGGSRGARRLRVQGELPETRGSGARLRILGGTHRSRVLFSPSVHLRPMMGKVREALFSTFTSFGLYEPGENSRHLDIFAGSGSVGLESLSRGAAAATFVDLAQDCADTCRANVEALGLDGRGHAVCADALVALNDPASVGIDMERPFEIVTITPPYEEVDYGDLTEAVANSSLVGEDTVVAIEYPVEMGSLPHVLGGRLVGVRNRRYGRTVIAIYVCNPSGKLEVAKSRPEEFIKI
eukprot:CAMPEP_0194287550 /NCGR_PEP_ID=MMETSP0169-20130528/34973_1 /TAXON_ID=218684 /ORGANISM="Corethron pennatum, Strain L29A3" /LENGTH=342 /DNA_ID=CAMNT_0039034287 /DNA_START=88 /DNA_END=1116 /DNA_ORIENTATION=-